jgi:antagonist of KipI
MELKILRSGMLTSVQDLGRRGYRSSGVPLSGAMDSFALRVANSLVGNSEDQAVLEFTLVGPELEFTEDALVAVTGAECEGVRSWRPFEVQVGERLKLGACVRGCRGYVAVNRGIDVAPVLGSRSTYLRGRWGGFEGRALREGDRLAIGPRMLMETALPPPRHGWQIDPRLFPRYSSSPVIRAIRGSPESGLTDELFATEFKVSPQSDRMGLRLIGENFPHANGGNLLSATVVPGTVQIPPDGQPVILMADAQTIGGYRQAAHVVCVDLPLVAQLRPGDRLRFVEVSIEEAHRLTLARDRAVAILREGLAEKLSDAARASQS